MEWSNGKQSRLSGKEKLRREGREIGRWEWVKKGEKTQSNKPVRGIIDWEREELSPLRRTGAPRQIYWSSARNHWLRRERGGSREGNWGPGTREREGRERGEQTRGTKGIRLGEKRERRELLSSFCRLLPLVQPSQRRRLATPLERLGVEAPPPPAPWDALPPLKPWPNHHLHEVDDVQWSYCCNARDVIVSMKHGNNIFYMLLIINWFFIIGWPF
jgi:hypothetical protein